MHGLEPYPDGWRAKVPRSEVLPHYPTVLHRGGFPDGSCDTHDMTVQQFESGAHPAVILARMACRQT